MRFWTPGFHQQGALDCILVRARRPTAHSLRWMTNCARRVQWTLRFPRETQTFALVAPLKVIFCDPLGMRSSFPTTLRLRRCPQSWAFNVIRQNYSNVELLSAHAQMCVLMICMRSYVFFHLSCVSWSYLLVKIGYFWGPLARINLNSGLTSAGEFCCRAPRVHLNELVYWRKAPHHWSDQQKNGLLKCVEPKISFSAAASRNSFDLPPPPRWPSDTSRHRPSRQEDFKCVFLWRCFFLWLSSCMSRFTPS